MAKKMLTLVLLALFGIAIVLMMGAKQSGCLPPGQPDACIINPVGTSDQVCCLFNGHSDTYINECFCTYNGGSVQYLGACR